MTDTSGSLNDLLAEFSEAFPGWEPDKQTRSRIEKAASKFSGHKWKRTARKGLDRLLKK
jgi:hypothetical protein